MDRGKSSSSIALLQKVSQRRVQQLYKQYKDTGEIPVLQECGRKKQKLTAKEESIILNASKYKVNALALEKVIDRWKGSIHRTPFHVAKKGSIHCTLF